MKRPQLLKLLRTALSIDEHRFAREIAVNWLSAFPGDLQVSLLHAQALANAGLSSEAISIARKICQIDPIFISAWETLNNVMKSAGSEPDPTVKGALVALGKKPNPHGSGPDWGFYIWLARHALNRNDLQEAETLTQQAIAVDPDIPLIAITHLEIYFARLATLPGTKNKNLMAMLSMANFYHNRWPDCIPILLLLADLLMDSGEQELAVRHLHKATAFDIAGQIPQRFWGTDHPYKELWPRDLTFPIQVSVPASVAAALGQNLLPGSESPPEELEHLVVNHSEKEQYQTQARVNGNASRTDKHPSSIPLSQLRSSSEADAIHAEMERFAKQINQPEFAQSDGRYPVYILFSTRKGLENKFGKNGIDQIDNTLKEIVATIKGYRSWSARIVYGDDPGSINTLDLKPAKSDDPWGLKLLLADLDTALRIRGEMIGALLIVGGPEIVPFHYLPNPIDDDDPDVPSDNPYATRDENYFVPEWPVGRIPDGMEKSPQTLLDTLKRIQAHHARKVKTQSWWRRYWNRILVLIGAKKSDLRPSLGISAEIWKRASRSVYRTIGKPNDLLVSPPVEFAESNLNGFAKKNGLLTLPWGRLGYFNLHGLADSPHWFGQRDPFADSTGPDYPIALRPVDILNGGRTPEMVFSEACFGANIANKRIDESLALKFLSSGTKALVGSTVTSYGTVSTPLVAADLLGYAFWKYLRTGYTAGEALRRAKLYLTQEMHRRQGYLDGEDQKTLISFILYGDPLALPNGTGQALDSKSVLRTLNQLFDVKTVCDRTCHTERNQSIPNETMVEVKRVVAKYLPGMKDAVYHISEERNTRCENDCEHCPFSNLEAKSPIPQNPQRKVVTLSKYVKSSAHTHHHFARLTINGSGKVIKLVVSR